MQKPREFVELQPKLWQTIYLIYKSHKDTSSSEEIVSIVTKAIINFNVYNETESEAIAKFMVKVFSTFELPKYISQTETEEAFLYVEDIRLYKEKTEKEKNLNLKKLLLAFMIFARLNPHPSFWIRYDREEIFFLAGLTKLKTSEQELLTKSLHKCYDLNMQVVGSNSPIPCFKIEWLAKDYPEELKVLVGDYNPETIEHLSQNL